MMSYPSVKDLPISTRRLDELKSEFFAAMRTYSVIRRVLHVVSVLEEPRRAVGREFHKIGVSSITDKIWFVDGSFGDRFFHVSGIGTSYAMSMATAETKYLMDSLSSVPIEAGNEIRYGDVLTPGLIYQAASILESRGYDPNFVFTNVKDHVELWRYPEYGGSGRNTHLSIPGRMPMIVDFAPEVPEGTSYVLDARRFAALVIKRDLNVSVSDLPDTAKPKLLAELPELSAENIDEKVRLLIEEVLRVDMDESNAAVILRKTKKH